MLSLPLWSNHRTERMHPVGYKYRDLDRLLVTPSETITKAAKEQLKHWYGGAFS